MKKLALLFILTGATLLVKAQTTTTTTSTSTTEYHAFKVDIMLGYAIPSASTGNGGTKAGVAFDVQPHYRLTDDFAVGLRIEGAALGYEDVNTGNSSAKISVLTSYCPTAEYYFTEKGIRPYVGAGLGIFTQSAVVSANENNSDQTLSASITKFGFFPEAGIEAGHFRFTIDYDVVGNNDNYLAFTVGAFFGGGRK